MKRTALICGAMVCWIIAILYLFSAVDLASVSSGGFVLVHLAMSGFFLAGGVKLFKLRNTVKKEASSLSSVDTELEKFSSERKGAHLEYSDEVVAVEPTAAEEFKRGVEVQGGMSDKMTELDVKWSIWHAGDAEIVRQIDYNGALASGENLSLRIHYSISTGSVVSDILKAELDHEFADIIGGPKHHLSFMVNPDPGYGEGYFLLRIMGNNEEFDTGFCAVNAKPVPNGFFMMFTEEKDVHACRELFTSDQELILSISGEDEELMRLPFPHQDGFTAALESLLNTESDDTIATAEDSLEGQSSIDLGSVGEKAAIILEYSDEAAKAFKGISNLPDVFQKKFIDSIEEGDVTDYTELALEIRDEYETVKKSEQNPYDSEELNRGYGEALKIGANAADEFKRVIEVLGDKSDITSILSKLKDKYFNSEVYKGYTIQKGKDRRYRVIDSDGLLLRGSTDYGSVFTAKEAIDYIG
jgi:hypothetical protein